MSKYNFGFLKQVNRNVKNFIRKSIYSILYLILIYISNIITAPAHQILSHVTIFRRTFRYFFSQSDNFNEFSILFSII